MREGRGQKLERGAGPQVRLSSFMLIFLKAYFGGGRKFQFPNHKSKTIPKFKTPITQTGFVWSGFKTSLIGHQKSGDRPGGFVPAVAAGNFLHTK